jgi:hypothetical protein
MTKSKVFLSTVGVLAAAGAVVAGVLMNKKGKIKAEGEIEKKNGRGLGTRGTGTSARGSGAADVTPRT